MKAASTEGSAPRRTGLKILISLFLVYHLAAVIILPNGSSMVGRKFARYFLPYANSLLFNRTWQFFSPGPAPAYYVEYRTITNAAAGEDEERAPFIYPPLRQDRFDDLYFRSLGGLRLLSINPDVFERQFIPYLCRLHPEARALDLRSVTLQLPSVEQGDRGETFKEMAEKVNLPRRTYECPGGAS